MTDDHGVRELLSFLLARDTMHQNQWLAAAQGLRESGMEQSYACAQQLPTVQRTPSVSY